MPTPEQARLTLSTFRPESVDDHEANLRAIDRAHANLPFFEETVWNKLYDSSPLSWVPSGVGDYRELGNFWWTKQFDWTRIRFMCDIKILSSPDVTACHFEVRISQTDITSPVRTVTVAGARPGTITRSMAGRLYDTTPYPNTSLRNGRWYVSFGIVTDVPAATPGTQLQIGRYESCYFALQEIHRRLR